MSTSHLAVASAQILTSCDSEGATRFQVKFELFTSAVAVSASYIICGVATVSKSQLTIFDLNGTKLQEMAFDGYLSAIQFNNAGDRFACRNFHGQVRIFALQDREWALLTQWCVVDGHTSPLAWRDDDICLGDSNGLISIWDSVSGTLARELQQPDGIAVTALQFSPSDHNVLFSGLSNGCAHKWNVANGSSVDFKPHSAWISSMYLCNDLVLLTCSHDCTVAAFDSDSLEIKWRYHCSDSAVTMDVIDNEVFVGVLHSVTIAVLDVTTGQLLRQFLPIATGCIRIAAFNGRSTIKFVD